MNNLVIIGNCASEIEVRYIPNSEKAVANFSIAVNRPFSKEKEVDFFNVVTFGKQAENCGKYLQKGLKVAINGYVKIEKYESKTGEKRTATKVIAERVEFLEWGDKPAKKPEDPSGFAELDTGDEVPF